MGASPPIEMANIGMADTIILMILALVVFGPRRLPQIGRQIGKLMYEFRKASNDFKFQMEEELRQAEEADRRKKEEEARQRTQAAAQAVQQTVPPAEPAANAVPPASALSTSSSPSVSNAAVPPEPTSIDSAAGTTQPIDATVVAVEAARLRIQPPSTGEVVATNRPGAVAQPSDSTTQTASNAAIQTEAAKENSSSVNDAAGSEPASHHG